MVVEHACFQAAKAKDTGVVFELSRFHVVVYLDLGAPTLRVGGVLRARCSLGAYGTKPSFAGLALHPPSAVFLAVKMELSFRNEHIKVRFYR
jgi:hypothetical protein